MADGYIALIEKLNWKRVTIITDEDELNLNVGHITLVCTAVKMCKFIWDMNKIIFCDIKGN